MKNLVILVQCTDRKGIVAKVSGFIFKRGGNITALDQHSTNPGGGHFFMRVEFSISGAGDVKKDLAAEFKPVASAFRAKWGIYDKSDKPRMGVLVSRPDHCLADLLYLVRAGELNVKIPFVLSNHDPHRGLVESYGIPFFFLKATKADRKEAALLARAAFSTDFLVLARYMLVLSKGFLKGYGRDIINIHHGFLPSFKGARPYERAFKEGVKVIGATAHFVTERLDEGPIINQAVERVSHEDDVAALVRKGRNLEKRALSEAVAAYVDYRIIKYENKTVVF